MKKTYMNPDILVVKLQVTQMLASSIETTEDIKVTPGTTLSREFDYDEDYEDEEEY